MSDLSERIDIAGVRALVHAKHMAMEARSAQMGVEMIVVAILHSGPNVVTEILGMMQVDPLALAKQCRTMVAAKHPKTPETDRFDYSKIDMSDDLKEAMRKAESVKSEMGDPVIGVQHMLLGVLRTSDAVRAMFDKHGLIGSNLKAAFAETTRFGEQDLPKPPAKPEQNHAYAERDPAFDAADGGLRGTSKTSARPGLKRVGNVLDRFCVDLTAAAIAGELDPVIGRDAEIERVLTTLCRKKKNNPLLVGEPGVGKTAVIEGVAQRIAAKCVRSDMRNKRIFSLNMTSLVANTNYRGQFEERMRALLETFKANPEYVLFVDEIHTVLGAGSAIGSLDAGNIIKPALAAGHLRCIGATTENEYKKYFRKDEALDRRFQRVIVNEPSREETQKILHGLKLMFEKHHACKVSDEAVAAAVDLTEKYVADRHFPDKAIDCIDEMCARYSQRTGDGAVLMTREHVARVIADQAQIPLDVILASDSQRVARVKAAFKGALFGQDAAIDSVVRVLRKSCSGIRDPARPIGSFVLGGASGVGKTYTAELLAKEFFPSKDGALVRINMSEFSEKHMVSKLIGVSQGYVGFGEKNSLTDRVLRRPHSLVLLDDADKAHPDVVKLFLPALSNGVMVDGEGREVSFRNAIVAFTVTMGTGAAQKTLLGFQDASKRSANDAMKDKLVSWCRENFGSEFVNRIDEFAYYADLSTDDLSQTAAAMLDRLAARLVSNDIVMKYGKDVVDAVVERSKLCHGSNANRIVRVIDVDVESAIAEAISSGGGRTLALKVKDGAIVAVAKRQAPVPDAKDGEPVAVATQADKG